VRAAMRPRLAALTSRSVASEGVTNSDVAKALGLQSDYAGGSKDYLFMEPARAAHARRKDEASGKEEAQSLGQIDM